MESTQGLPLEVRLSAYLDGQLPEAEVEEIDAILASDDDARAVYEQLKLGSEFGARAFDRMLEEPIPLDLVRTIKDVGKDGANDKDEPPKLGFAAIPIAATPAPRRSAFWPQALAASLVIFLTGGAAGYLISEQKQTSQIASAPFAPARSWLDDIADYHRIYSHQTRHLAEVPASEQAHIVEWLSASTGVDFTVPDLSAEKLTFEGARLLVAGGKPTAQLLYRDAENEIFAICFLKGDPVTGKTELAESMRDDIGLISWQKGAAAFVVVGPSSDPDLERIAETVAATI